VIEHVGVDTPPDSRLDKKIVQNWDEVDPYSCVSCGMPFDSMKDRLPYLMPCRHNACIHCLREKLVEQRVDFDCPIDSAFVTKME